MNRLPKKVAQYGIQLVITVVLVEIACLTLFGSLTGESFQYRPLESHRLERVTALQATIHRNEKSANLLYSFHPYIGYAGTSGAYPWGEKAPPFNAYGMLSLKKHAYPYKRQGDEFVVAVMGGSVAEIFANTGEDFLRKYSEKGRRSIVLIPLATGGYKQPQQLFHLQYAILAGFEFDAVLNIDGFNDLALAVYNFDGGVNPLFPSAHHLGFMSKQKTGLDMRTVSLLSDFYSLHEGELNLLSFVQRAPFKYSVFLNLLSRLWTKRNIERIKQAESQLSTLAQENLSDEFRGPSFDPKANKVEIATRIWADSSRMLYAVAKANRLQYIHVLQPSQYVEGSKVLSEQEKKVAFDLSSGNKWALTAKEGYPALIAAGKRLKEEGVPFFDLTMVFKDYREDIYVDTCCHFDERGNEILAERIAKLFSNQPRQRTTR